MNELEIKEIINDADYSIDFKQESLFKIRMNETRLYDFLYFKIDDSVPQGIRNVSGKKLFEYCRSNSIVISTDDLDYDRLIVNFLIEYGFRTKFSKIIYEKDLREHHFQYHDIFEYESLEEFGLDNFMKVFEKTSDVGI